MSVPRGPIESAKAMVGSSSKRTLRKAAVGIPDELRRRGKLDPEELVPVGCSCPGEPHGVHQVRARRVMKGGDLHGKVYVGKVTRALIEEAER